MPRFACVICATPVTADLRELPDTAPVVVSDAHDLLPRGTYLPVARLTRALQASTTGMFESDALLFNLDDLQNTRPGGVRNGCCGVDGIGGLNTFCRNGHPLGVERSDCWTPRVIHIPAANLRPLDT